MTMASLMASARGVIMTSAYEKAPYFSNGLNNRPAVQIPLHRTTSKSITITPVHCGGNN
jgi:hypothetical protein